MLAAVPRIAGDEYDAIGRRAAPARAPRAHDGSRRRAGRSGLRGSRRPSRGLPAVDGLGAARGARRAPPPGAGRYDAVLATGPPTAALLAARAGRRRGDPPLVVELRDLWAGNPLFDRRGGLLGALERWVFAASAAIVTVTPEAAADVRRRHPVASATRSSTSPTASRTSCSTAAGRERPWRPDRRSCTRARSPPTARSRRCCACSPASPTATRSASSCTATSRRRRGADRGRERPRRGRGRRRRRRGRTPWRASPPRDVALVTQAASAGDATAVAGKVYEYLALGRPVLCLSAGGATEAVLRGVGADDYCARLDDDASIARALDRLRSRRRAPAPVAPERLAQYRRTTIARRMARAARRGGLS